MIISIIDMEELMKIMMFFLVIKLFLWVCVGLVVLFLGLKVVEFDKDIVIVIFNIMVYDLFKLYIICKRYIFCYILFLLK